MNTIGIIGSGAVGRALGIGFATLGHSVMIGSREPEKEALVKWRQQAGANAKTGSLEEAATFGEIMIVATKWEGTKNAITLAGLKNSSGKTVIDTTNPIAPVPPSPEGLITFSVGKNNSAGEEIQRLIPDAQVVKAFSIVGSHLMVNPSFPDGDADMYICGNDNAAKATVTGLLGQLGWKSIIDCGKIDASRAIEPIAILWCIYGFRTGTWNHAFKILKK
jgi:predicted dinucleotide-binding enzyme